MGSPDFFTSAIKMLAALGIVLGGMFLIAYFARRYLRRDMPNSNQRLIRVAASQYIGVKKQIALVEVPGTVLVLGVTGDHIQLLAELKEGALQGRYQEGSAPTAEGSFAAQLDRFTARFKTMKARSER
jgi:flagellar biosynthetic protein FliO